MAVTSPPYWGLRDYGVAGQLGLEATPAEYVARLVEVFRELRRVLRDDGTFWLNIGDRYCTRPNGSMWGNNSITSMSSHIAYRDAHGKRSSKTPRELGVKHKDLFGLPWEVAFALRADGWYLRSEIVWHKPNPLPESVQDRPTKSHEHVFMLAKSETYYYDAHAIREPVSGTARPRGAGVNPKAAANSAGNRQNASFSGAVRHQVAKRNKRSVWTVATQPYDGAHFACFPPNLIKPAILAGSSPRVCGACGTPWKRQVEKERVHPTPRGRRLAEAHSSRMEGVSYAGGTEKTTLGQPYIVQRTTGWDSTCEHDDDTGRAIVLDPFMGSGTTAQVAQDLGRDWIGIELNPDYHSLIAERTRQGGLTL